MRLQAKRKRGERSGRSGYATNPVAKTLRPLRPSRFLLLYPLRTRDSEPVCNGVASPLTEMRYDFGLTPAGMVGAVVVLIDTSMLRPSQRSWPGQ